MSRFFQRERTEDVAHYRLVPLLAFLVLQAMAWLRWFEVVGPRWDDSAAYRWALARFYVLTGLHAALAAMASWQAGGGHLLSLSLVQTVTHCIQFSDAGREE